MTEAIYLSNHHPKVGYSDGLEIGFYFLVKVTDYRAAMKDNIQIPDELRIAVKVIKKAIL